MVHCKREVNLKIELQDLKNFAYDMTRTVLRLQDHAEFFNFVVL